MLDSLTGGCGYYGILSSGGFQVVGGYRVRAYTRTRAPKKESGDPRQVAGRPTHDMQGSRKGIHTISCVRRNVKPENEKS